MSVSSIFNDVIGPIMRGPSSSHTAGSYHVGRTVRDLLGEKSVEVVFSFHPGSSYAKTFRPQGVMEAYACAMLDISLTDERFLTALKMAEDEGMDLHFIEQPLRNPDHPNSIEIEAKGHTGRHVYAEGKSTGGGTFVVDRLNDWNIDIRGKFYEILVECMSEKTEKIKNIILRNPENPCEITVEKRDKQALIQATQVHEPDQNWINQLSREEGVNNIWQTRPVYFVPKGKLLFNSAKEMVIMAMDNRWSLGQTILKYEASLLGLPENEVIEEMSHRLEVMKRSAVFGFSKDGLRLRLLTPSALDVRENEQKGMVAVGGIHTRAAACALAVMHATCSRGVICAAPTGGAAGTVPGVVLTLMREFNLPKEKAAMLLFAAAGVGLITAIRATFSAEIAGCQVEIGVAGAMAAAAIIENAGGTAIQATDAAAISLQNTMGLVCDHVQSMCEIPCHTRNAIASSSAFTCADLILGGYRNPIDLDETIDAAYDCGRMLPKELRCTAGGGLSRAPAALKLKSKDY
jgi:L-serine dehydratase